MSRTVDAMHRFAVDGVKIGGEIGRRLDITVAANILKIDVEEQFLRPFRERTSSVSGYVGLGKLLDGIVRFSAYTNDDEILRWKRRIADTLMSTQEEDGYIGAYPPDIRMWYVWDVHEMSYLVYALVSDYLFFGEKGSLESSRRLMDYMIDRWKTEPDRIIGGEDLSPWLSTAGFDQALMALYVATRDPGYLEFARRERELETWDEPIVVGRHGRIEGHVYLYLSRGLAQQELYRCFPNEGTLLMSDAVMDFIIRRRGMVASGACGRHECWHVDQGGGGGLGETCASAHLVWFMDSLLRLRGDSLYGDFMERIVYNTLFAAQSPDGRRLRYYTPMEGERKYFDKDTYCCPNNFRRVLADLPAMVYYRTEKGIAVNLYTESTLEASRDDGVSIRIEQRTDYPGGGGVFVTIHPSRPIRFALFLRIPGWCPEARIAVPGEDAVRRETGGRFASVERLWHDGDTVRLEMPMTWRLIRGRESQAGKVAVMRGPVLFGLDPAANGMEESKMQDLRLNFDTLTDPISSDAAGPGGQACRVDLAGSFRKPSGLRAVLTEFADPNLRLTYFPETPSAAGLLTDDELFQP